MTAHTDGGRPASARPVIASADPRPGSERRARRLLRWYPSAWRERYGEEFTELLIAEMDEQPRSWRRSADVVRTGLVARFTDAGLRGVTLDPAAQARAALASLGCAAAIFVVFGLALWSQLSIGWQWSAPDTGATLTAMILMSGTLLLLATLAALAAAPIGWRVVTHLARGPRHGLVVPAALFLAGATVLIVGGRHFANGWPGTGAHPGAGRALVPGGVAAFGWASTLSVSSYWAHPGALRLFPTPELVWMAVSPIAIVCLVAGAAMAVRRVGLSPRVLRYQAHLARVAALVMFGFLLGACAWISDGGAGPETLFHVGAIDMAEVAVLAAAVAVAYRAAQRAAPGSTATGNAAVRS